MDSKKQHPPRSEEKKPESQEPSETADEKKVLVSQKECDELREKLKAAEDKILRMAADFENSKKRLKSQSEDMVKFANEKLVTDILPVVDDLDRAITSLDQGHDPQSVKGGLHLVQNTFHKILGRNGVQAIDCLNKHFDPHWHEAVGEVEDDTHEEGTIVDEVQRGYLLNGRLARPSRVRISKRSKKAV